MRHRARLTLLGITTSLLLLGGVLGSAQPTEPEPEHEPRATDPTAALSAPLRAALIAEMQQLDVSLQRSVSQLARADWAALAKEAATLSGSFILKKQLTPEQREELARSLPVEFLRLDQRFHVTADKLHDAARAHDAELAAFYASRLITDCVECHGRFAKQRFPAFQGTAEAAPHSH